MKKRKKTQKKYYCKKCDFTSNNKTDFNRHLSTTKHKMITNGNSNGNSKPKFVDFSCDICGKVYKYKSGLSRHRKACVEMNQSLENNTVDVLGENLTDDKMKVFGRTEYMTSVIFNGNKSDIGKIVKVKIKKSETITGVLQEEVSNRVKEIEKKITETKDPFFKNKLQER